MPDQATSASVCPGGRVRKDAIAPKPYSSEFRADVVRVTGNREPGMTIGQIAKDFGVHPMTLHRWLPHTEIQEGATPGQPRHRPLHPHLRRARCDPPLLLTLPGAPTAMVTTSCVLVVTSSEG